MRRVVNGVDGERGMVVIVTALSMLAILAVVAIVLDLGYARQESAESQIAADAAALAGARELPTSSSAAIDASLEYVVRSLQRTSAPTSVGCRDPYPATVGTGVGQQQTACYLIDGDYLEITANYRAANRMRVESSQASPAFFGVVAGKSSTEVVRAAVAELDPGGTAECGLCVIGTGTPFDAQNGDIILQGDAGAAINGNAETRNNGCLAVDSGQLTIHSGGTVSGGFYDGTSCDPSAPQMTPTYVGTALANPLEFLDALAPTTTGPVKSGCDEGPGVYASIPVGCDLDPGLYIISGGTHISGHEEIRAPGVTFYFTCGGASGARPCNSGETGAELTCTGQARISVTAPTTSPDGTIPPGVAIWFDANNEGALDCRGNGAGVYAGTIYGQSATIWNRGNGACTGLQSLVVIGRVRSSGNPSSCTITYNTNQNVQIPPNSPRLVE